MTRVAYFRGAEAIRTPHLLWALFLLGALVSTITGCQAQAGTRTKNQARRQGSMQPQPPPPGKEIAVFAGGCFWCTEAIFRQLKGVESVEPGYSGGHTANPSYEQVCTSTTGHAESIRIVYDPKVISYHDLLRIFFTTHDPTTLNRQGADVGTQYRSAVFYANAHQKEAAHEVIAEIEKTHVWPARLVTEVTPLTNFYVAEDYHKDYYDRNSQQPYCQIVIAPKVAKLREHYRAKLKP